VKTPQAGVATNQARRRAAARRENERARGAGARQIFGLREVPIS
jgi:hypothetical protein